jgi:hypothetical protein
MRIFEICGDLMAGGCTACGSHKGNQDPRHEIERQGETDSAERTDTQVPMLICLLAALAGNLVPRVLPAAPPPALLRAIAAGYRPAPPRLADRDTAGLPIVHAPPPPPGAAAAAAARRRGSLWRKWVRAAASLALSVYVSV